MLRNAGDLGLSNFKLDRKNAATMSGDFRSRPRPFCRRETAANGKKSRSSCEKTDKAHNAKYNFYNVHIIHRIYADVLFVFYRFPSEKNNGFNVNDGRRFVADYYF